MKNKYGIGFLICMMLAVCVITEAYQVNLEKEKEKLRTEMKTQKQMKEEQQTTVTADGQALKEDGYYLKEKNGYVVVYLKDKKTAYEYTDILLKELPETLQKEIKNGKYIKNTQMLYGFLENYSS